MANPIVSHVSHLSLAGTGGGEEGAAHRARRRASSLRLQRDHEGPEGTL